MARAQRSLKTQTTILRSLQSKGQVQIADFMDVSEATVSTLINKPLPNAPDNTTYLTRLCDLLAGADLKVVPVDVECHTPEYMKSLKMFARRGIDVDEDIDTEAQLWSDD